MIGAIFFKEIPMLKKTLAVLLATTAILTGTEAMAKKDGGFTGPSIEVITIEQAKGMSDDTFVILRGNITQNIGDELYVFTDGTGTINIEIDDEDWNGQNVGPEDLIEIRGEIDKGWTSIEIDVDSVSKIDKK